VPALSVLVDATSIPPNRGGVARYIAGLLGGLAAEHTTVDVVVKRADLEWLRTTAPGHRYRAAPGYVSSRPARLLWEQLVLPLLVLRLRARVLHSPHYTFPLVSAGRTVVTLHDATFFSDPAAHGRLKRTFFRLWTRLARTRSVATITPSAATASEIDRFVGTTGVPNTVAHLGVDRAVFHAPSEAELAAFRTAHALDPSAGWVAFLGTVEPRKQVGALVAAHARLAARPEGAPPLLVAGGIGWDREARALLEQAGDRPGSALRHLGYLPLEELRSLLGGATAVVYPSIGEGFGLPVLEAMACGAAVVTTDRLAIPEVGGDAVLYVEPTVDGITTGLAALLEDEPRRETLGTRAADRAATFDWAACARAHIAVFTR
jgi:glycosyltransferase involved in cell wall biosynthesis